jgi:hypothetical protein
LRFDLERHVLHLLHHQRLVAVQLSADARLCGFIVGQADGLILVGENLAHAQRLVLHGDDLLVLLSAAGGRVACGHTQQLGSLLQHQ